MNNKKSGVTGSVITIILLLVLVFTTSINIKSFSNVKKQNKVDGKYL